MRLSEYIESHDIDVYALAHDLSICKGYLMNISYGIAQPSKRLAKSIEEVTAGQVTAEELRDLKQPVKKKCPTCGCYYKIKES